jgi:hypothetical protein
MATPRRLRDVRRRGRDRGAGSERAGRGTSFAGSARSLVRWMAVAAWTGPREARSACRVKWTEAQAADCRVVRRDPVAPRERLFRTTSWRSMPRSAVGADRLAPVWPTSTDSAHRYPARRDGLASCGGDVLGGRDRTLPDGIAAHRPGRSAAPELQCGPVTWGLADDGNGYATALLDDVAVWDEPLGADQVALLASGAKTPLDFAASEQAVYFAGTGRSRPGTNCAHASPARLDVCYFRNTFQFEADPAEPRWR